MGNFSVCIIAKNEEKYIERCLKSIADFDCEIVVVDTGSTDNTIEIVKKYTTKIYHFDWVNDFSAARNFSISKASNDWILVLDCDEWVKEAEPARFLPMFSPHPDYLGVLKRINLLPVGSYTDDVPRFFNRKYYHYERSIHEQLVPLTPHPLEGFNLPLTILHSGYNEGKTETAEKHIRNMSLLEKELEKDPDNPYFYFQIGQEHFNQFDYQGALPYYEKVLTYDLSPQLEYYRLSVQSYGECLIQLKETEKALEIQKWEPEFGDISDFHYLMGRIYVLAGQPLNAMPEFIKAISLKNPRTTGTDSHLSWYYLAAINEDFGNIPAAISFYENCGDFQPAKAKIATLSAKISDHTN